MHGVAGLMTDSHGSLGDSCPLSIFFTKLGLHVRDTARGANIITILMPQKRQTYQNSNWYQHLSWFFETASTQAAYARRAIFDNHKSFFGLWLPNLAVGFSSLLLMLFSGKKMRPGYSAWFIFYFAVSYGTSWLLSGPRYMAVFFPLAIAVETLPVRRKWILYLIALPPAAAYTVLFALRWSVW